MPPRCSFIIPVLNEAGQIASLLRLLGERFPAAERIVVDGGSADGSDELAAELAERVIRSTPGRALQMNAGARIARGEYLLFLHADSRPDFSQEDLDAFLDGAPTWGFGHIRLLPAGLLINCVASSMHWRSRLTRVATGDQLIFVQRAVFQQMGGYADMPLMEDVELSKRLRRVVPPMQLPGRVVSSSRRWREQGVLRTIVLMWSLRLAYVLKVNPQRLWRLYYG